MSEKESGATVRVTSSTGSERRARIWCECGFRRRGEPNYLKLRAVMHRLVCTGSLDAEWIDQLAPIRWYDEPDIEQGGSDE